MSSVNGPGQVPPMPPPPVSPPLYGRPPGSDDAGHLNLLRVFYLVMGGLSFVGALGGLVYIAMGLWMIGTISQMPASSNASPVSLSPASAPSSGPAASMPSPYAGPSSGPAAPHASSPKAIFAIFPIIGGFMILVSVTQGILLLYAARFLRQRTHWVFILVMAGLLCLNFPGMVLGVFTFIVLLRPSVKAMFGRA